MSHHFFTRMTKRLTEQNYHDAARKRGWQWVGKSAPTKTTDPTSWKCDKGHRTEKRYNDVSRGQGCGVCYGSHRTAKGKRLGIKPARNESLAVTHPDIAKELHSTKNGDITAFDVTYGSKDELVWHCPNSKLPEHPHDYPAVVKERTRSDAPTSCPYCAGKKVAPDTRLTFSHPEIAAEWHPTKNGKITPSDVTYGSGTKRYWICKQKHVWPASPNSRTSGDGHGCGRCAKQSSRLEIRVYCECKTIFEDVVWREKVSGKEVDVLIPTQHIAIEVDGKTWHAGKENADIRKNETLEEQGYTVVRIRGKGLPLIVQFDIEFEKYTKSGATVRSLLGTMRGLVAKRYRKQIDEYVCRESFANDKEFRDIIAALPGPPKGKSVTDIYPELAETWDSISNAPLIPSMFTPGSHKEVWWLCDEPSHGSHLLSIKGRVSIFNRDGTS